MLIIISLLMLTHGCMGIFETRQMPQPDLSGLRDDKGILPLSSDYMPAVMHCLHYYTEMMQYEQIQNVQTTSRPPITPNRTPAPTTTRRTTPFTTKRTTVYTTTRRTTVPTTTRRPTQTTTKRPFLVQATTPKPQGTRTTKRKPLTSRTTRRYPTSKRTPIPTKRTTKIPYFTFTKRTTKNPFNTVTKRTTKIPNTSTTIKYPQIYKPKPPNRPAVQTQVQKPHKPGVYAPEKPPYYIYFELPLKPEQNYHKPGVQQPPQSNFNAPDPLNWQDAGFVSWFFQPKPPKVIDEINENDLKYLDILPKKLLLEIAREPYNRPAILDLDNVKEFRKKYDDSYDQNYRKSVPSEEMLKMNMRIQMQRQRAMLTGKKKAPPTRPYVLMIMLYDLLKKEAKARKLHEFGGYSPELIQELYRVSQSTGVYQMKYLFQAMLKNNEVSDKSIIKRVNDIIADLDNPKADAYKALTIIPPFPFLP